MVTTTTGETHLYVIIIKIVKNNQRKIQIQHNKLQLQVVKLDLATTMSFTFIKHKRER
jgi:hypothetical protein